LALAGGIIDSSHASILTPLEIQSSCTQFAAFSSISGSTAAATNACIIHSSLAAIHATQAKATTTATAIAPLLT